MAVVQRGSKWQVNRTVRGVRAPRLSFDTRQEAEAWEAEAVAAIMAGREIPVPSGRTTSLEKVHKEGTLGHVARECFDRHWKDTRSAKTQDLYIGLLKDYFGADTPVASITKPMIEDWMHHCREQGNAGSTVNRKLSTLSKILSYAEGRYITARPRVQRYPESLPSIRWL